MSAERVVLRIDEEEIRRRLDREREQERNLARRLQAIDRPTTALQEQQTPREPPAGNESGTNRDDGAVVAELVGSRLGMRREQCSSCGLPVFLAEKLVVARSVYHRSCFRCARCRHQLTPGNYYETEAGQYCCEACPEPEEQPLELGEPARQSADQRRDGHLLTSSGIELEDGPSRPGGDGGDPVLEAPLSDEEKSKRRSLERAAVVEQLLRKQRTQLELVTGHLLAESIGELSLAEPPAGDNVDGAPSNEQPTAGQECREPKPQSDEEKSAIQQQQQQRAAGSIGALPQLLQKDEQRDDGDDKFDEMIKRINERIDELTTDEQPAPTLDQPIAQPVSKLPDEEEEEKVRGKPELEKPESPVARESRGTRINSAPNLGEAKRAIVQEEEAKFTRSSQSRSSSRERRVTAEEEEDEAPGLLRRSSSLRAAGEYTKEQRPDQPRRLSLVQRRIRNLEEADARAQPAERSSTPTSPVRPERSRGPSPSGAPGGLRASQRRAKPKQPSSSPAAQDDDDYPEELNPFASEDEQEPSRAAGKPKKPASSNPFGSSSDEEAEVTTSTPKPAARPADPQHKRVLEAPKINLNPFWSDEDGPESGAESEPELRDKSPPVPRPRTLRHSHQDVGVGLHSRSNLMSSSLHSTSNTSIASACSTMTQGSTYRKKKPAPLPPGHSPGTPVRSNLNISSASSNPSLSPRLTPRTRKSKPAPPPPMPTPPGNGRAATLARLEVEPKREAQPIVSPAQERPPVWDEEKLSKDEANRTTQSLSCVDPGQAYLGYDAQDKSLDGKWKRKKGPAPPRPTPLRRKIKIMSMKDVKLELDQIEMQQQGLEKQGVRLEQIIRDKSESGGASEDTSLGLDVEELILELFALVNEKNELFRRQAELMLLRRQQRLEEEHADIEYQVRCLISQSEATKTDFDKQREEALIQRLVEIVERRNEIVECLEMDRRREIEEDRSIHQQMDLYAARNKSENVNMTDESRRSAKQKKGKTKEKVKEKKTKKSSKKDADKDVDESESKHKRHSLRKWF